MGTLNIINKSPFEKRSLEQCLRRIGVGDSVLLIEDATIAAVKATAYADLLQGVSQQKKLYVLQPDLQARGIDGKPLLSAINRVDYEGFVELVVSHDRVHSWL